ncbi:efflux RND transporter periplasmic adaptor subunit [Nitrincola alkalisediminis]|uniref:efflux RND transporter periplasmic adaptor subunit n=1 Tax=Nitrincola alkalisediminis TaxID=1366656 RepID=UPI001CA80A88|nr:efflux RND transporter periplasmic adaptor subunit [Nitrincola alkalisediminis]
MHPPWHYRWCMLTLILMFALIGCEAQTAANPASVPTPRPHLVELFEVTPVMVGADRVRTGNLRAKQTFDLFTREEGQLLHLPYHPGDRVEAGALLAELDDTQLSAQRRRVMAELSRADSDLQRARSLAGRNLISAEELQRRETDLAVLRAERELLDVRMAFAKMTAPFAGVVTQRLVEPGAFVAKNTHLMSLSDPSVLRVDLRVSEQELVLLSVGDAVELQLDTAGSSRFPAYISRIYPDIDPITRRGQLEITASGLPSSARSGQLVRVRLTSAIAERLMVPFSAIRVEGENYVYVVNPNNEVEKRSIQLGQRIADQVEVIAGLSNGESIVIRGFMGLTDGRRVTPVTPLALRNGAG